MSAKQIQIVDCDKSRLVYSNDLSNHKIRGLCATCGAYGCNAQGLLNHNPQTCHNYIPEAFMKRMLMCELRNGKANYLKNWVENKLYQIENKEMEYIEVQND